VTKLDVLLLDVLLDDLHNMAVLEGLSQLRITPVLSKALDELALYKHEDATDLSVGVLGDKLHLVLVFAAG